MSHLPPKARRHIVVKKTFKWSSSESQLYDESYGSQKLQQGNFDKNVGSAFVMDAPGCGLILSLDSDSGEIVWPVYTTGYSEPATMEVINGDLIVNSGMQYIGADPRNITYLPIVLNFSRNSNVELNCKEQFTIDIDKSSEFYLRDDATLAIKVEAGIAVLGGGELNVLDNSELKISALTFDFKKHNPDSSLCFTLGFGNNAKTCKSKVVFSGSVLKTEDIPKGIFNFNTSATDGGNYGCFIFDNVFGFYKANIPDRELFSVDNNVIPSADFDKFFDVKNISNTNLTAGFSVSYTGRKL